MSDPIEFGPDVLVPAKGNFLVMGGKVYWVEEMEAVNRVESTTGYMVWVDTSED